MLILFLINRVLKIVMFACSNNAFSQFLWFPTPYGEIIYVLKGKMTNFLNFTRAKVVVLLHGLNTSTAKTNARYFQTKLKL